MTRRMAQRPELPWIFGFLFVLALGASPATAQQCAGITECFLSTTCTGGVCQVGVNETFTLNCERERRNPENCQLGGQCCETVIVTPQSAWYTGQKLVNGQWVVDASCVQASNPLHYTFQSSDAGQYRRAACFNSNCSLCSQTLQFTVQ
jgi:hypothetical protein